MMDDFRIFKALGRRVYIMHVERGAYAYHRPSDGYHYSNFDVSEAILIFYKAERSTVVTPMLVSLPPSSHVI